MANSKNNKSEAKAKAESLNRIKEQLEQAKLDGNKNLLNILTKILRRLEGKD